MQFEKPTGLASVTSGEPGLNKVPLGQALQSLTSAILDGVSSRIEDDSLMDIDSFCAKHTRYADTTRLEKTSCPHALKAWAAERLPGIGISYGFVNQVPQGVVQANIDEQASLWLVQFADDLTMIARFCRKVHQLKIEALPHFNGMEFRLRFEASPLGLSFDEVEQRGFQDLLKASQNRNALKNRIISTETQIEAQCIVLRKRMRLGFSPMNN